jgi:ABC-type amino acid transport system permease subunit
MIIPILFASALTITACIATVSLFDIPKKKRTFDNYLFLFARWYLALAGWFLVIIVSMSFR